MGVAVALGQRCTVIVCRGERRNAGECYLMIDSSPLWWNSRGDGDGDDDGAAQACTFLELPTLLSLCVVAEEEWKAQEDRLLVQVGTTE